MDSVFPVPACWTGLVPGWDSAWRLEIPGRAPEPPPSDTLSALHQQHDFHCSPRAGGAPSGKNKQTWRPSECKCTDPAHLTICEYGALASAVVSAVFGGKSTLWGHCVYTWRTACTAACGNYTHWLQPYQISPHAVCVCHVKQFWLLLSNNTNHSFATLLAVIDFWYSKILSP